MSDDSVERLGALEAGHRRAFRAFDRPSRGLDRAERHRQWVTATCQAPLNPELVRRVYDGAEGTIDLIPGPGMVCCVVAGLDEELIAGTTSVELAARGVHGFISTRFRPGISIFRGVLSRNVRDLRIVDASGRTFFASTNEDDAYWITVADAVDLIKTMSDGTEQHIPFNSPRAQYTSRGTP